MKRLLRTFNHAAAVAMVIVAALSFSSCNNEDDNVYKFYYSMGFTEFSASGEGLDEEGKPDLDEDKMEFITNVFKKSLNVTNVLFSLTGTSAECNKEVIEACEEAAEYLDTQNFEPTTFTFEVTNGNLGKSIYTYKR